MKERFETFTVLISKIYRNIRKLKNQEMAEYGLRGAHISCLYYLYSEGALTPTELCERCEEDKATISRALEYLEERDYIAYPQQTGKRYKCPLHLTEQGKTVGKEICDRVGSILDEVSAVVTEEERLSFYRSLSLISGCLDKCVNGSTKIEE